MDPIMASKAEIIAALYRFVARRPGLEFGNYGSIPAYRQELRQIAKMRHKAERLLECVGVGWRDSITAEDIIRAARTAFSGRLSIIEQEDGTVEIDYCTGQYFPTEYRAAVCAVLRNVLVNYFWPAGTTRDAAMKAIKIGLPRDVSRDILALFWGKTNE